MQTPKLFLDRGCPFAHRVLALLDHLGVAHDTSISEIGSRPEGVRAYSPSGRIPLLVHGDVVIGESRVMLEHLSEAYGFANAYPRELERRTLHRHAMAFSESVIVPRIFAKSDDGNANDPRLAECLDVLTSVANVTGAPEPCLLAFHLAPMWLRCKWWRPDWSLTRAIRARAELVTWLEAAAALAPIARTSTGQEISLDSAFK